MMPGDHEMGVNPVADLEEGVGDATLRTPNVKVDSESPDEVIESKTPNRTVE